MKRTIDGVKLKNMKVSYFLLDSRYTLTGPACICLPMPTTIRMQMNYTQVQHIKGTWSVHSSNGEYLSISKCTGRCGYLFMKSPVPKIIPDYNACLKKFYLMPKRSKGLEKNSESSQLVINNRD